MEIFQEPTFTAFVALILSFVVAKIVSFAVSYSPPTDCSCVDEVALAKDGVLVKGEKRVNFVDGYSLVGKSVDCFGSIGDGILQRVDQFGDQEMSQEQCCAVDDVHNDDDGGGGVVAESDDCFGSIGDGILERFDQFGDKKLNQEQCFVVDDDQLGMLIEGFGSKEENSVPPKLPSVAVEGKKDEVIELRSDHVFNEISDHKENEKEKGDSAVPCGESEEVKNEGLVVEEDDDGDDDDWEGIERSELEKAFAEAVNYVEYREKDNDRSVKLSSDVHMHLYGLHKVALEGPCHDPQPMALKVSARAKWNAWQRLGSMTREAAMEHYIALLSNTIPGWVSPNSPVRAENKVLQGQDGCLSRYE